MEESRGGGRARGEAGFQKAAVRLREEVGPRWCVVVGDRVRAALGTRGRKE